MSKLISIQEMTIAELEATASQVQARGQMLHASELREYIGYRLAAAKGGDATRRAVHAMAERGTPANSIAAALNLDSDDVRRMLAAGVV
ncbi:MAG: hypothetical protein LBE59_02175 [Nevskiaceae bacterium]|jgi:hypothetical protein|nr:hypothetical protein [Nevskiaceae bacterium]